MMELAPFLMSQKKTISTLWALLITGFSQDESQKKKFGSKIFVFFRPFVQASKRVWEIELFALSNCKVTTWINIKETRFKAKTRLCPIKFEVKRKLQTHLGDDFVGSFILWRIQTFMITLLFLSKDDSIFSEKGTIPELACKWLTIGHTFAYERGRTPSIYRSSWERSVIRPLVTVVLMEKNMRWKKNMQPRRAFDWTNINARA